MGLGRCQPVFPLLIDESGADCCGGRLRGVRRSSSSLPSSSMNGRGSVGGREWVVVGLVEDIVVSRGMAGVARARAGGRAVDTDPIDSLFPSPPVIISAPGPPPPTFFKLSNRTPLFACLTFPPKTDLPPPPVSLAPAAARSCC
jgi:hypothetical protein